MNFFEPSIWECGKCGRKSEMRTWCCCHRRISALYPVDTDSLTNVCCHFFVHRIFYSLLYLTIKAKNYGKKLTRQNQNYEGRQKKVIFLHKLYNSGIFFSVFFKVFRDLMWCLSSMDTGVDVGNFVILVQLQINYIS